MCALLAAFWPYSYASREGHFLELAHRLCSVTTLGLFTALVSLQYYTHAWGGPPDWNNRSSSIRLELSVGHVVRVCESPCVLRACGRPAHSNLDLTVASNIAQEHRPTSVQRMRYCWTARMVYKFTPRSFPRLYIHTYKIHDQAEHCPIRLQAWADSQLAIGGWSYRGRERITV